MTTLKGAVAKNSVNSFIIYLVRYEPKTILRIHDVAIFIGSNILCVILSILDISGGLYFYVFSLNFILVVL